MTKYYKLKVKKVIQETPEAITIYFKQPLFRKIKYHSGQFLTLIVKVAEKEYRRSYSICTSFGLDSVIGVTVKRLAGGIVSNFLNDTVKAGDDIQVMEPTGNFTFIPDKKLKRHIVLIAAGSGITPIFSMLKSVLLFEPSSFVSLIYANRNQQSIIFKELLQKLKNEFKDRLQVLTILSQPQVGWQGLTGRINKDKLADIFRSLSVPVDKNTNCYICGPNELMDEVKLRLSSLAISEQQIFTESFIATQPKNKMQGFGVKTVKIILDAKEYQITVPPDKSILEAALDKNIDVPFSCQSGLCTACRGLRKSGEVKTSQQDGLGDEEIALGYVLTCGCYPISDDVVIKIK